MDFAYTPVQKTSRKRTATTVDQDDGPSPSRKKLKAEFSISQRFPAATTMVDESSAEITIEPPRRSGLGPLNQQCIEDMLTPKPILSRTDAEFEERYKALKILSWRWVTEHIPDVSPDAIMTFDRLRLSQLHPELMEYVNYIASYQAATKVDGNVKDDDNSYISEVEIIGGWEVFFNSQWSSIVFAILGKVLEVHVFGHEMFGSSDAQLKALRSLDLEMINLDGFARQASRASAINSFLSAHDKALPPLLLSSLQRIQNGFIELISPLHILPTPPSLFYQSLSQILLTAAKLSLDMRREPNTIYHIIPISKDIALDPHTTYGLNTADVYRAGFNKENHQQIVLVAAWPLIDAYRKGNGRSGGEDEGIRVRRIGRAEAYVGWGSFPRTASPRHKGEPRVATPNSTKSMLIRAASPFPQKFPRYKSSTANHSGENRLPTNKASPRSPSINNNRHRSNEPGDKDPWTSGPSLREDLAARREWLFPNRYYLAPALGILMCALAAGGTFVLNENLSAQAHHTAATVAVEMAGRLGTLEERAREAVMKMVNEAGSSAVKDFARKVGWG